MERVQNREKLAVPANVIIRALQVVSVQEACAGPRPIHFIGFSQ